MITACDMLFASPDVTRWIFAEAEGHNGATYEWPNGWIEPFLSVYRVEPSLRIARELFEEKNLRLRIFLRRLPDMRNLPWTPRGRGIPNSSRFSTWILEKRSFKLKKMDGD